MSHAARGRQRAAAPRLGFAGVAAESLFTASSRATTSLAWAAARRTAARVLPERGAAAAASRGAATVEAVIVIPFLLLVAVCVTWWTQATLVRQQALTEARACAWRYSAQGCEGPVPEGCSAALSAGTSKDGGALVGKLDEVERGTRGGSFVESVSGVPVVGPMLAELFTRSTTARVQHRLRTPPLLGGGQSLVGGRVYVACNVASKPPSTVAREVFGAIVHLGAH